MGFGATCKFQYLLHLGKLYLMLSTNYRIYLIQWHFIFGIYSFIQNVNLILYHSLIWFATGYPKISI